MKEKGVYRKQNKMRSVQNHVGRTSLQIQPVPGENNGSPKAEKEFPSVTELGFLEHIINLSLLQQYP